MSDSTTPSKIRGHCPNCGPNRLADVVSHFNCRDSDEENHEWWETDYRILRCGGCEAVYFQTDDCCSDDQEVYVDSQTGEHDVKIPHKIAYWPAPTKRKKPDWSSKLISVDDDIHSLFEDIYTALNNDLRVLSAIGIRTAFDRSSELLEVDPAMRFDEKLNKLVELGKIGMSEKDTLDILTDAGSAAAHRGWKPTPSQLDTMMSIFEGFIHRAFILDAAAKRLKKSVPAKPKRKKKE